LSRLRIGAVSEYDGIFVDPFEFIAALERLLANKVKPLDLLGLHINNIDAVLGFERRLKDCVSIRGSYEIHGDERLIVPEDSGKLILSRGISRLLIYD
jgi:hypothetical protein